MANNKNLKVLSPNEAREFGRVGGIASGKARKEYKKIREIVKIISTMPARDLLTKYPLKVFGDDNKLCGLDNPNILEAIIARIAKNAVKGNTSAAKLFLELLGAMPTNQSVNIVACQTTKDAMQVVYGHTKNTINNE